MIPYMHVSAMAKPIVGGDRKTSAAAARNAPRTGGRRPSDGTVSGRRRAQQATPTAATPGSQNSVRHGANARIAAPTLGAIAGTRMNVAMMCDIVRAIRSPASRSRTIARASDRGAAAPKPHATRQATSTPSDGATAQAAALTAIRANPTLSSGLRP